MRRDAPLAEPGCVDRIADTWAGCLGDVLPHLKVTDPTAAAHGHLAKMK
jgi:hypothetical protein